MQAKKYENGKKGAVYDSKHTNLQFETNSVAFADFIPLPKE